jgi:hypothetical protein
LNKNFEAGALGKVEKLSETEFRCHVEGQSDEHGRNRQANWYYFELTGVKGKSVKIVLTDFLGEYNGRPGACPMDAGTIPVFSYDNRHWQHFSSMDWNDQTKEATLQFTPEQDAIWVAHVPPYPFSRVERLLEEVGGLACVRTEVIGKTAQGRDLHLVTVTDFDSPDAGKKSVWLIARQHAWETGTSYVLEGALRFISSDAPAARELRKHVIVRFTPTMDPDGCTTGKVRFNANGYDLNRHWDEVDLRSKEVLMHMPEIWYVKKAIVACAASSGGIDLLLNLHNDENSEYIDTEVTNGKAREILERLSSHLASETTFDSNRSLTPTQRPDHTTDSLFEEHGIPVATMEQRISRSGKLGRQATGEDRLAFGGQLIRVMCESVLQ